MSIGDAGVQEAMEREALAKEHGEAWLTLSDAFHGLDAVVARLRAPTDGRTRAEQVMIDDAVQVVLEARGNIAMLRDEAKRSTKEGA
jgi:hypothetical protein